MGRKKRTAEEQARREKIRELLQLANVGSMEDIQNLFQETIAEFIEDGLEAELDEELGYSRYDHRSKTTDNSRSGHSCLDIPAFLPDMTNSGPWAACPGRDRTDGSRALCKRPVFGVCGRSCPPKCAPDNIHSAPDTGPPPARGLPIR